MPSSFSQQKLYALQQHAWEYFNCNWNPGNGLVADTTQAGAPCSIAATGFALSCYPIAARRGWLSRREALKRTLAALRFFAGSEQSTRPDATGYRGFYYHFLDMTSGRREWKCELSTIDTTLLFYGMLTCAQYFDRDTGEEREARELAETLIERADWRWACHDTARVALAWKPERIRQNQGFQKAHWSGYNEALLLQILALGAKEYSLPESSYDAWCATYNWKKIYDHEFLYAGPLFIHQFPHAWLDLRDVRDEFMRAKNSDYFQNSCRATAVQQEYARRNPRGYKGYHEHCWGLTAGDGPGKTTRVLDDRRRRFFDYRARGVPFGPDDGTLAPWAMIASLPFAPDVVLPSLRHIEETYPKMSNRFGFRCSFNPTFTTNDGYWISPEYFGLDQGPVVLAIENHLTGFIWKLLRENKTLRRGLRRAGFAGGWLATK